MKCVAVSFVVCELSYLKSIIYICIGSLAIHQAACKCVLRDLQAALLLGVWFKWFVGLFELICFVMFDGDGLGNAGLVRGVL